MAAVPLELMPDDPDEPPIYWDNRLTDPPLVRYNRLSCPQTLAPIVRVGRSRSTRTRQAGVSIFVRLLDEQGNPAVGVPGAASFGQARRAPANGNQA